MERFGLVGNFVSIEQCRTIFAWLVPLASDRTVRHNGKYPKFARNSLIVVNTLNPNNNPMALEALKPQYQHVRSPHYSPYISHETSWENLLTHQIVLS